MTNLLFCPITGGAAVISHGYSVFLVQSLRRELNQDTCAHESPVLATRPPGGSYYSYDSLKNCHVLIKSFKEEHIKLYFSHGSSTRTISVTLKNVHKKIT